MTDNRFMTDVNPALEMMISEDQLNLSNNKNKGKRNVFTNEELSILNNYPEISRSYIAFTSQDIFTNALLCHWDNIYGPRLLHIWSDKFETYSMKMLQFSARQILSSQILEDPSKSNIDKKIFVCRENRTALVAALFGAKSENEATMHALIIFANFDNLEKFLVLKGFFLNNIFQFAQELKMLLTLNQNRKLNLITHKFENLLFITRSLNFSSNLELSSAFSLVKYSDVFLHNVLYCHLSQCCRTIVIASCINIDAINQMIRLLSLFTLENQFILQYISSEDLNFYSPHIQVQGLIKTDKNMEQIINQVYNGNLPSALIDLDLMQCFILCPLQEYFKKMKTFVCNNLQKILDDNYEKELIENLFLNINISHSTVLPFLAQVKLLLYDNFVCKNYVTSFIIFLQRKAISLIKSFEAELKSFSGKAVSLLTLRKVLGLKLKPDFEIILSLAELCKPGFVQFLNNNSIEK